MQNKVGVYAHVLHEALKGVSLAEQKKRIHAFKEILKKRGDSRMSHSILQEFSRLQKEEKGKAGKVVSAKPLSSAVQATLARTMKATGYTTEDHVDPAVIGGVAVFLENDFLIDNTILGRLRKLLYGKKLSF